MNLSVFETFFEERRPFFVEGSSILNSGSLFYSRRIGRQPGHFSTPSGAQVVDWPDATTILSAAKLTGKTASKTSIGILEAVTAPEYATIEEMMTDHSSGAKRVERREHLIEPLTNYFVARVQQDVLKGNSRIGFLATAVNRRDAESAYVGAIDWDLRLGENAHQLAGTISASRSGTEEESGLLADFGYTKTSGWFRSGAGIRTSSPDFNPNDLGYMDQVNRVWPWLWMQFHKEKPYGPFRSLYAQIGGEMAWSLRHEWAGQTERWTNVLKDTEFIFVSELKNSWRLWSDVRYGFETMDDLDTRGGPHRTLVLPHRSFSANLYLGS